jgi:hypothetical protein
LLLVLRCQRFFCDRQAPKSAVQCMMFGFSKLLTNASASFNFFNNANISIALNPCLCMPYAIS